LSANKIADVLMCWLAVL